MNYPMSMDIQQKTLQSLKQQQRLIMSPQMQQAINLLQLPILELTALVENELEQNPVIEMIPEDARSDEPDLQVIENEVSENTADTEAPVEKELIFDDDRDFAVLKQLDDDFKDTLNEGTFKKASPDEEKVRAYLESSLVEEESLFEHLMIQARETFDNAIDLKMSEHLIGNLNEKGFLDVSLEEICLTNQFEISQLQNILKQIQTFEPFGIGAKNLQDSLLIQLKCKNLADTLAYKLLEIHYEDLLHNRLPVISKHLNCSLESLIEAIDKHISCLDLHPGMWYSHVPVQYIKPDLIIVQDGENLKVEVLNDYFPTMRLNRRYMRMLDDPNLTLDVKDFIKHKIGSAKWLIKNIFQRNETLLRIGQSLAERQSKFLKEMEGKLVPLTMKIIAEELNLHESTIARAVANKYMDTPRGLLSLRSFFTGSYQTESGEDISTRTVKDALKKIISSENKNKPLSDNKISTLLKERGMDCARRTVAKYRAELNIGNTPQRRTY